MQYQGGKSRIARFLVEVIAARVGPRFEWADPFCGGLSMSVALSAYGPGVVSDVHAPLIALYQAVADGWDPPSVLTEADYQAARSLSDTDPLKAFVGFGCSFGGKWFGGYARGEQRDGRIKNYAAMARSVLLRDVHTLVERGCVFTQRCAFTATGTVLYLDPPYQGTQPYSGAAGFDHAHLVRRCAEWAWSGSSVFVSEYGFNLGSEIWSKPVRLGLAGASQPGARTERLYHVQLSDGVEWLLNSLDIVT